ncbi:MAG: hypothetical protein KZQ64_07065, partial [gamma proteobacterium symbiont of Bathyaustriella thionipta]|nr:hypothetical protein [gamma proteobacterium symbiont of Bathyaustriella thionipta]MCU7953134.1 hypothetical protein [gamma proteobacterium symbiont of Bathyaustriella thionipta]MCU7966019.1 hypothetical protein [gamma proteobacterium symbiont of Bathyaustriella thionipta]
RHVGFNKLHNFSVKLFFSIFFKFMLNSYEIINYESNDLLRVRYDIKHQTYSCGENPFVIAKKIDE